VKVGIKLYFLDTMRLFRENTICKVDDSSRKRRRGKSFWCQHSRGWVQRPVFSGTKQAESGFIEETRRNIGRKIKR
jgi:hypothetical protein